ncbi:MAG: quinone-dependent dihydroorotate dehydrogenase [Dehalococcoidia bacterium]
MGLYQRIALPVLRRLDPETSHSLTLRLMAALQPIPLALPAVARSHSFQDPRLTFTWRGLAFRNPVGVAAGVDKNGRVPRFLHAIGAGFIEVGTVTPKPQEGNPRPRVFRLPRDEAMVNHLGFPGEGAERLARRLGGVRLSGTPLGVNIGKNAATPLDTAVQDYLVCLETLYPVAGYFVVNVSSPNTEGLTSLQARDALAALTEAVVKKGRELARAHAMPVKPLLVKVSPDLTDGELDAVIDVCLDQGIEGIVAVNTSTDPALRDESSARLQGGLSGRPLRQRAVETVAAVRRRTPGDFFIVGVGGVFDAGDAWSLLRAGANAVQMYTGLVYRGPGALGAINRGLLARVEEAGLSGVADAVGRA